MTSLKKIMRVGAKKYIDQDSMVTKAAAESCGFDWNLRFLKVDEKEENRLYDHTCKWVSVHTQNHPSVYRSLTPLRNTQPAHPALFFRLFFLAVYITPVASRSCLVYGYVFIIDMSLSADDNNSSDFSRFSSAVAASTHHPVKKMRDQAYRICRDYLSGSWKSISSNDMVFRSIRWVRLFLFTSCAGPVPGLFQHLRLICGLKVSKCVAIQKIMERAK